MSQLLSFPSSLLCSRLFLFRQLSTHHSVHRARRRGAAAAAEDVQHPEVILPNPQDPDFPRSNNDRISTHVRNRNPMNLERMRIGYKPEGFALEKKDRCYWNKLELSLTSQHTTARVTHWTGRTVCSASTKEWAIRRFLYNMTDAAALEVVAKVIGQRSLETGVSEVFLKVEEEDLKKERMRMFVDAVKKSGLVIGEGRQYKQINVHAMEPTMTVIHAIKPWEIVDE